MQRQAVRRRRRGWRIAGIVVAAVIGLPLLLAALAVVLGLVAAVVALALSLAITVGPWLAVGYAGYRIAKGRSARSRLPPAAAGVAGPPAPPVAEPVRSAPPPPAVGPLARLPEEQRAQAERVRAKAAALLQQPARFATGSRNLHLVHRTLDTYLPSTLGTYLRLPDGARDVVVAPDGRTALQVLRDQLTILEAKLDEVANDLWQVDVQRLLANERFLEEHFGRAQPDELTIR
jgi:hypothetical protein